MGKHSTGEPLTVEELAAQARAERRRRLRSPAVVGTAAAAVLALGAAAWAFSQPEEPPETVITDYDPMPTAPPSFIDGFGQVVVTTADPSPIPTRPGPLPEATPTPASTPMTSPAAPPPAATAVSATYTMSTWPDAYKMDLVLTNRSAADAVWTLRFEAPAGARLDQMWNAEVTQESTTVWVFRPPRWDGGSPRPVPAGGEFTFGFIVQGGQTVVSCTLDGVACQRAN